MKISIDTKEDSPEEIKKAIRMLSSLVGEKVNTNQGNVFEDSSTGLGDTSESGGSAFGNMFGDDAINNQPNEDTLEEEPAEKIQIVEY
jgi:hypothetical protein